MCPFLYSEARDDKLEQEANIQTSLLPPTGISTNKQDGNNRWGGGGRQHHHQKDCRSSAAAKITTTEEKANTMQVDNRTATAMLEQAAKVSSPLVRSGWFHPTKPYTKHCFFLAFPQEL